MSEPVTLALHLHLHGGVLGTASPAGDVRLDADAAEELVERIAVLARGTAVRLRVQVTAHDTVPDQIPAIVRHHYAKLRERAEYRLRRAVRAGRFSLIVGTAVLLATLALAETVSRMTTGGLGAILQEGLTIVGWVALWRPLDLLLFERWALRRDIALYRRLEQMEVEVVGA
ncbi:MAG TPA: hypothetical protein VK573_05245 [Gemmatimonadales bacterium]|nr:hypothetical protein [Gemmatimonadales bacterium]